MLSLLSEALDLLFPPEPRHAINWLSVFAVDVHGILQLECWGVDWYARWLVSVCVVPLCAFSPVMAWWLWKRRQDGAQGKVVAMRQGLSTGFFVVMLLYPRVSAKIFAVLRCRWLGPKPPEGEGPAILEDDYNVDCMSEEYGHYWTAAIVLVVLIPIGVPLVALTVLLHTARSTRRATTTQLVRDDEAQDEFDSQLAVGLDEKMKAAVHMELSTRFAFLVDDYRPGCYWYEPGAE